MGSIRIKVTKVINGQPTQTNNQEQYFKCCDCSLVHLLRIRSLGKEFVVEAYRDDYLTNLSRNKRKADKRKR